MKYFNLFAHDYSKDECRTKVKHFLYQNVEREDVIDILKKMKSYNDLDYEKVALLFYQEKVNLKEISLRLFYSYSNIKRMYEHINLCVYVHFFINEKDK